MVIVVAVLVLLAGGAFGVPGVVAAGAVATVLGLSRLAWTRDGSTRVEYSRRLGTDRAVSGDAIPFELVVRNRGALPIPWVRSADVLGRGVAVRIGANAFAETSSRAGAAGAGADLDGGAPPRIDLRSSAAPGVGAVELVRGWSLGPYERVVQRGSVLTDRRGVYQIGPTLVTGSDLLGRPLDLVELDDRLRYIVRPRMVAVTGLAQAREWDGELRSPHGQIQDPSRFAGVRPYQHGDPVRRLHWRAYARTGRPLTKRFDPSREQEIVIALDVRLPRTAGETPADRDEALEGLVVAGMSLARALRRGGAAIGLALAGHAGTTRHHLFLPPSATDEQLALIADVLARLDPVPSIPMSQLLAAITPRLAPGTTVLTLGLADPVGHVPALRQLVRQGFGAIHVAFGADGPTLAGRARAGGVAARSARLDGPWRTSRRLDLAG